MTEEEVFELEVLDFEEDFDLEALEEVVDFELEDLVDVDLLVLVDLVEVVDFVPEVLVLVLWPLAVSVTVSSLSTTSTVSPAAFS